MTRTRVPRPPARQPARTAEPDRASPGTARPPPPRAHVFHGGRPPAPPAPPYFAFRSLRIQGEHAGTVQLRARDPRRLPADAIHQVAAAGVHTSGQPLPHRDRLQRAFGPAHDLSGITAHIGGAAAEASARLGADGYALGDHVAFRSAPDLRLAAHETAHVLQQRGGIRPPDGVGHAGDRHEQQADAVAERVVRGQSVADLLPAPATLRAAVQLDEADVNEAESYLQRELTAYEARAASLPPGPEKAAALRVILLLQAQAFTAFASAAEVAALLTRLEAKARNERATLAEYVDKLGVDEDAVLLDAARAFPGIWADRLAKMFARIDENDLARVMDTTQQGALGLATALRDDIWDQGLPLTLAEANQLTWGLVFASVLNLELAESDSEELSARFARAVLRWERATRHYILVHAYNTRLRRKVDDVRAGQQVMDQGEWSAAVGAEQVLDNQLDLLRRRDLGPASTIFVLQLFEPPEAFYRVTATPSLRHRWPQLAVDALATELARVDQKITGASSSTLIWRAGAWAYHRGYFGDLAREAWNGFVHDIPGTVAKMMAILGLQYIPGINILADVVLICEFGFDILETALDLFKMFQKAGSAKSLLDLEHASARMAQTLVGTAAKLVLWAVTWGVAKGAGKIRNWRDAERFVRDNSRTPAARDEARRLLSEANGNAEKARKLLENKRALERQQREAARAAEQRRQAEADAAAKRKTEAEAANKRRTEDEARRRAEQDARRHAEEQARRKAEEDAKRQAEEDARRQAEEDARRQAEEDARRQAEAQRKQVELNIKSAAGNAVKGAMKKYIFEPSEVQAVDKATRDAALEAADKAYKDGLAAGQTSAQANTAANKAAVKAAERVALEHAARSAQNAAARAIASGQGDAIKIEAGDTATPHQLAQFIAGATAQNARRLAVEVEGLTEAQFLRKMAGEPVTGRTVSINGPPPQTMTVYEYPDGTVVRYKPLGDAFRPGPTYSIEVKKNPSLPDTGSDSAAFKVDPVGRPVPKGRFDIQNPYQKGSVQSNLFQDAVLDAGHRTLRQ